MIGIHCKINIIILYLEFICFKKTKGFVVLVKWKMINLDLARGNANARYVLQIII